MKKLIALFLLAVLAFNIVGYPFVLAFLHQKEDVRLAKEFDKHNYKESDLVKITVPIDVPYFTYSNLDFQRLDGEITLNGILYKYVTSKIENGTLILHCLPNHTKPKISKTVNDYFATIFGVDNEKNTPNSPIKKAIAKNSLDEFEELTFLSFSTDSFLIPPKTTTPFSDIVFLSEYSFSPEKPPQT